MRWLRKSSAECEARERYAEADQRFKTATTQATAGQAGADVNRAEADIRTAQGRRGRGTNLEPQAQDAKADRAEADREAGA